MRSIPCWNAAFEEQQEAHGAELVRVQQEIDAQEK
jgi:hypothetical protein